MITYRRAAPEEVRPALDLAMTLFMEFDAPHYEPEAVLNFRHYVVENEEYLKAVSEGECLMLIAHDGSRIAGVIGERGNGHISILFVDSPYHRMGIATGLMKNMVCQLKLRKFDKITLNASPYGLPFNENFGFVKTQTEQKLNGFIFTPMEYVPNEIWDVLDENGNKTGRYAERGRQMAAGDYHLVVHVWKRNSKGEWLIDKRAPRYGDSSLDGKWETTGGSAVAGDDSLSAALRETREELGIELDPGKGVFFKRTSRIGNNGQTWFEDAWVFEYNEPIESVHYDGTEVCDAMWATTDKIREMMTTGECLSKSFYPYFDEMVEKWEGTE